MMLGPLSTNGGEAGICHYFWLSINFNALLHLSGPSFSSLPCGQRGHVTQGQASRHLNTGWSQQLESQRGRMEECVLMLRVVAVIAHVGHGNNGVAVEASRVMPLRALALTSLVPTHSKSVSQPSQYFGELPNVTPINSFSF